MTYTGQTTMNSRSTNARPEDQMTSYELLAAERSAAIRHHIEERGRRATLLDEVSAQHPTERNSRRLRLRLSVSRPA